MAETTKRGRKPHPRNTEEPLEPGQPGIDAPDMQEELPKPLQSIKSFWPHATMTDGTKTVPMIFLPGGIHAGWNSTGRKWGYGWVSDRLTLELLQHPKVQQGLTIFKNSVLGRNVRSVPCVPPSSPDWDDAVKFADFCNWQRRNMAANGVGGSMTWYSQMRQLCAPEFGHKIGAIQLRVQDGGQYDGKWVLDAIDVWANFGWFFLANEYGRFCGIRAYDGGDMVDIDLRKFLIFTFRPLDDHPHGTSILYPLCEPFYKATQMNPELMALVTQYGRPGLYVIAPELKDGLPVGNIQVYNPDGTPMVDANNQPLELSPLQYNSLVMQNYRAGTVVNLAGGSIIGLIQATPGGDGLFRFLKEDTDRDIIATILGTDQLTEAPRVVSGGNAGSSEALLGTGVMDAKRAIEEMDENAMANICELNFGARGRDLAPITDLGSGLNPRLTDQLNSTSSLVMGGAYDIDQYFWWCVATGQPIPNPDAAKVIVQPSKTGVGGNSNNTAATPNQDDEAQSDG